MMILKKKASGRSVRLVRFRERRESWIIFKLAFDLSVGERDTFKKEGGEDDSPK